MAEYAVKLMNRAVQDLDGIYRYVSDALQAPRTAGDLIDTLEAGILSLQHMPYRCPERRQGAYANRGYRQLLVKNYTVIYRVDEEHKQVLIVTVRYSRSQF